jgi:hypothetical protein
LPGGPQPYPAYPPGGLTPEPQGCQHVQAGAGAADLCTQQQQQEDQQQQQQQQQQLLPWEETETIMAPYAVGHDSSVVGAAPAPMQPDIISGLQELARLGLLPLLQAQLGSPNAV